MKFFLFLLTWALGVQLASAQTTSVNSGVSWSGKNVHKSAPIFTYPIKDSTDMATLLLPHPTMFTPVMENPDSFNLSLIYCSHPEMNPGEVYLINIYTGLYWERLPDGGLRVHGAEEAEAVRETLKKIPFKVEGIGTEGFDYYGNRLPYCIPVFGNRQEFIKLGILKQ